jgi:hypothetical protein
MKIILEFEMPMEETEAQYAINGAQFLFAIQDVLERIRCKLDYEEINRTERKTLEGVQQVIYSVLRDRELDYFLG